MTDDILQSFALNDKVAVITGGGGDLCGAMAVALGFMGVKVALVDIQPENAARVAQQIQAEGGQAKVLPGNVLQPEELADCNSKILDEWGPVDLLITGAGGNHPAGSTTLEFFSETQVQQPDVQTLFDLSLDGFQHVFDLNFIGTFLAVQTFGRSMVQQGRGSIVTISSMSALTPLTKVAAYSAAKAAVANFTRWLAVYFSRTGVRVNALAPGFFMTEQLRFLHIDEKTGQLSERARKVIAATPMQRYGEPEDLLGTLIWLLSDASKFVTGVVIPVDGGFSAYSI
jgi:NAD(P)-dependent dehydrogenase (short-subunit alcohol dehydrogenase family)